MLSINTIARVVINAVRAAAAPAAFDTGLLLVKDTNFAASRRLQVYDSAEAAAAGLVAYGFSASTEVYKAAVKYFGASPAPSRLLVSCYPNSESLGQAIDAVLDLTSDFYGVMPCDTISAADWLAFAQHIEALSAPAVAFVPITGSAASAVAENGIADRLHGAQCKRTVPFYCGAISDCAALMGTAMGLELSHQGSAFALCYKTIYGIQPSDLSQTQVNSLKELAVNVYVSRGAYFLLENGFVSSGQRYDEVLYVDKIASELQAAAVSLLVENPDKLPQTDSTTDQFINRFTGVMLNYLNRGVIASGKWRGAGVGPIETGDLLENGYAFWADSYDTQSDADRAAHKAMPISAAMILAGSVESVLITVNVQI